MEKAKILKKDLPFDNLKANTVISEYNGQLVIKHPGFWYNGAIGYGSDGYSSFDKKETGLLRAIWDNEEWLEDVKITPIKWSRDEKSITLSFGNPIDLDDIGKLAKGIQRTLQEHYKKTVRKMGWTDELVDIDF